MVKGEAEAESSSGESALSPRGRKFIFVRVSKSAGLINDRFAGVCRRADGKIFLLGSAHFS
jgi:hypothetical protein